MTDYCTAAQVKIRLSGDDTRMSGRWDDVLGDVVTQVSRALDRAIGQARGVRGIYNVVADDEASERTYTSRYRGRRYVPIDDCVEVTSVTETGIALVKGTDYVVDPAQGEPIIGLVRLQGRTWPSEWGAIVCAAKWGMRTEVPADLTAQAIIESIRAYQGARSGYDDRIGMTPLGQVILSPAWTASTWALISDYSAGGGFLRS
jgi:hypothetical protein